MRIGSFHWYRDVAISVIVFLLLIGGTVELIEGVTAWPDERARVELGIALFASVAICVLLAAHRTAVLVLALAIIALRGVVAFVLQPFPVSILGLAITVFCIAMIVLLVRTFPLEGKLKYDPDDSSFAIGLGVVFLAGTAAVLLVRALRALLTAG
jgi:hypothetical protein